MAIIQNISGRKIYTGGWTKKFSRIHEAKEQFFMEHLETKEIDDGSLESPVLIDLVERSILRIINVNNIPQVENDTDPRDLDYLSQTVQELITSGGGPPLATTPPVDVDSAPASIGTSLEAAKADHKHDIAVFTGAATEGLVPDPVAATGKFLKDNGVWTMIPGGGDMLAATYDPTGAGVDVFDADNHVYNNATSGLTATDTQAAIDEIEARVDTNDAKVSNATHTGDVTGATALTIATDVVGNTNLTNMVQDTIKGRASGAGTGDPQDLTDTQVRTILNVADGANNYSHPNHTGDVTSVGDGAQTIVNNAVTNAKAADVPTETIKGRVTALTGDPEDLTVTQVRTLLNVADGATATPLSSTAPVDVTSAAASAGVSTEAAKQDHKHDIAIFSGAATEGIVPDPTTATGKFLKDDGTWDSPSGSGDMLASTNDPTTVNGDAFDADNHVYNNTTSGLTATDTQAAIDEVEARVDVNDAKVSNANHTGDVTGATALTIANDAVSNSKAANVPTATIKGRLTGTQATTLIDPFTSALKGVAPASGGGTTNFLRADGTWAAPAGGGTGDVTGPASSIDQGLVRFNGTTGKLIEEVGLRNYGKSATDPTIPTPAQGDMYFNTVLEMQMFFDSVRSKWLSVEINELWFGRNGNTGAGGFYRGPGNRAYSAAMGPLYL